MAAYYLARVEFPPPSEDQRSSRHHAPVNLRRRSIMIGVGHAVQTSHWGEVMQNGLEHRRRLITAVITLPRPARSAEATFQVEPDGPLTVEPAHACKAQRAARRMLHLAGLPGLGGHLRLGGNIRPGCGGGSSTADIIAAIGAVCGAVRFGLRAAAVQRLCWEIEGASDPLALVAGGKTVVYGSRTGEVVRRLGRPLPPMVCLGFNSAPGATVLTDALVGRESYTATEARDFAAILALAEAGVARGKADLVGRAATASARLNQWRVPTRNFERLARLASEAGALGLAVSHSGTVAALLFDPRS